MCCLLNVFQVAVGVVAYLNLADGDEILVKLRLDLSFSLSFGFNIWFGDLSIHVRQTRESASFANPLAVVGGSHFSPIQVWLYGKFSLRVTKTRFTYSRFNFPAISTFFRRLILYLVTAIGANVPTENGRLVISCFFLISCSFFLLNFEFYPFRYAFEHGREVVSVKAILGRMWLMIIRETDPEVLIFDEISLVLEQDSEIHQVLGRGGREVRPN